MASYGQSQPTRRRLTALRGGATTPPPLPVRAPGGATTDDGTTAGTPLAELLRRPERYQGQVPLIRRLAAGRLTVADQVEAWGGDPGPRWPRGSRRDGCT